MQESAGVTGRERVDAGECVHAGYCAPLEECVHWGESARITSMRERCGGGSLDHVEICRVGQLGDR